MPITVSHKRRRSLVCLSVILLALAPPGGARGRSASLVGLRSGQSGLPESIRRETFAAIDRSRQSLLACRDANDLWTDEDTGAPTVFPVLALCDPFPDAYAGAVDASLNAALARLRIQRSRPWTPVTAVETAHTALGSVLHGRTTFDPLLLRRLSRVRLTTLSPPDAACVLLALDCHDLHIDGGWAAVINTIRQSADVRPTDVAIAALGRLKNAPPGSGEPGDDVLAHVRWLAGRLSLGDDTPSVCVTDPLTPEAAFFITLLASQLPRRILARDDSLLPHTWRNHLANRLLAQQRLDPGPGLAYWEHPPDAGPDLRATTYAVMTLVLLAE